MPTFSASQIVGKNLLAAGPVKIKRLPLDSDTAAPVVYTAGSGQPVGVVYSWVMPGPGRSTLYWQFYDNNGRAYYAAHKEGAYNIQNLVEQGTLTVKEQTAAAAAAAAANMPLGDWIKQNIKGLVLLVAAAAVAKSVLPQLINRSKK